MTREIDCFMSPPTLAEAGVKSPVTPGKVTYAFAVPPIQRWPAKRKDGTPVVLLMRDWCDVRVAFDSDGNAIEAYQTEWWIDGKNHFVVVEKARAELGGVVSTRMAEDTALLDAMGIDENSIVYG
jgi:hypothetical protein